MFCYEGPAAVTLSILVGVLIFHAQLLVQNLQRISNGYTAYFKPQGNVASGLGYRDRLLNIKSFLLTDHVAITDPLFKI